MTEREQVGPPEPPLPSLPSRPSGTELGRLGGDRSAVLSLVVVSQVIECEGGVSFSSRVSNAVSYLCRP